MYNNGVYEKNVHGIASVDITDLAPYRDDRLHKKTTKTTKDMEDSEEQNSKQKQKHYQDLDIHESHKLKQEQQQQEQKQGIRKYAIWKTIQRHIRGQLARTHLLSELCLTCF